MDCITDVFLKIFKMVLVSTTSTKLVLGPFKVTFKSFLIFLSGFFHNKFSIHRAAGEGRGNFLNTSLPLSLHRYLEVTQDIAVQN